MTKFKYIFEVSMAPKMEGSKSSSATAANIMKNRRAEK